MGNVKVPLMDDHVPDVRVLVDAATASVAVGSLKPGRHVLHNGKVSEVVKVEHTGRGTVDWRVHVGVRPIKRRGKPDLRAYAFTAKAGDSITSVTVE